MVTTHHLIKIVKEATDVLDASEIEWFCNNESNQFDIWKWNNKYERSGWHRDKIGFIYFSKMLRKFCHPIFKFSCKINAITGFRNKLFIHSLYLLVGNTN